MRRIITLAACVTFGVSTWAAAQGPLTRVSLDDALQLALKQNATVRAKEFEAQAAKVNEITAGLRPNPTMNFLVEQIGLSGITPQYTVNTGPPIELGGKLRRRIESAKAATQVTSRQLLDVRRQTILQAQ